MNNSNKPVRQFMRIIHRYLGYFLAGMVAIYACSGIVLIFRDTDLFKKTERVEKKLEPGISQEKLGEALRMFRLKVLKQEQDTIYFENGTYNSRTGAARYFSKELPVVLNKLTGFHKASTKQPLFALNIFFGISLLFFAVSSFWMFLPKTEIFKKGLYFTTAGAILTLIVMLI